MRVVTILSAAIVAACIAAPARAAQVQLTGGWFRALPEALPAGGYFHLRNDGPDEAVIVAAESPACGMLMLHESIETGGVSRMEMVKNVVVHAGGEIDFKPGGYHLMCMKPNAQMKPGVRVPVTLKFLDGTDVTAAFDVKNAAGK